MATAQAQKAIWSTAMEVAEAALACLGHLPEGGSTHLPQSSATGTWSPHQRGLGWCQGGSQKLTTTLEQRGVKQWSTERNVLPLYWQWWSVSLWCAGSRSSSPTLYRQCAQWRVPSLSPSLRFSSGSVTATPHWTQSYTPSSTKTSERPSKRFCAVAPRVLSFSIQIQCIGHGHKKLPYLRHRKKIIISIFENNQRAVLKRCWTVEIPA